MNSYASATRQRGVSSSPKPKTSLCSSKRLFKRWRSSPRPPVDSLMPNRPVNGPMRLANWNEKRNAFVVVVRVSR